MTQSNFDLTTEKMTGPVECLGQTFESEEARRAHYIELLREKLKDPEFRKIEGFPIGDDEDILNLSDPPYYTACPNPWISDFIAHYGKPYDPKVKYHREPFAADVSEGKNHPIYNAHSYHTKVPHRAIMRYILHYTDPGDVVFDGFCGTGMTGVAAQLCGNEREVIELGYHVDSDGTIYNEEGKAFSKLGSRRAMLNDLSPAATFIAYNYNTPIDVAAFENEANRILDDVEAECGWMYETKHTDGSPGRINYVVWSDVYECPECGSDVVFYNQAYDKNKNKVNDQFCCPDCKAKLSKRSANRSMSTEFDSSLSKVIKFSKQIPVLINYYAANKRLNKIPDQEDLDRIDKINNIQFFEWHPTEELPSGSNTNQPKVSHGLTHVHHFYTKRSLLTLAKVLSRCGRETRLLFQSAAVTLSSKLVRYNMGNRGNGPLNGTLYVSSLNAEPDIIKIFRGKVRDFVKAFRVRGRNVVTNQSFFGMGIPESSLDYIFIDPPFGANINYSELNSLWESWLKIKTNILKEAIENKTQKKSLDNYRSLISECFTEAYRALKPGRWMTVEFSNTSSLVWNSIQSAIQETGFVVANVSALDKKQGSFKAVTTTTAVKQDLVISAYKPNGGLEKRFAKHGDSIEGVWDFLQTHLRNLPAVKPKGGSLEFIAERDPRILYDRMVAFYICHNTPVPLSSGEFQAALHDKYPERDGMVFLAEQVTEYDKKAAQMQNIGQLSIFVEDEKSAINWLRQFLKFKPSTYQGLHPEFLQQLSASWKKFETRPELSVLLDQNFLKYDGTGEVPCQIHGYLSTDYKDLRNKEKDDPALKAKAKDRWYVPDPKKAIDVEAVRNKRLLTEFWDYAAQAGISKKVAGNPNQGTFSFQEPAKKKAKVKKLTEVRTEAIRYGFLECHRNKDAATILAIAEILPNNVIEEDEQLQMIYDMAEMRAG